MSDLDNCAFEGFCRVLPESNSKFCPRRKALIDHFGLSHAEKIEFPDEDDGDLADFDEDDDGEDDA